MQFLSGGTHIEAARSGTMGGGATVASLVHRRHIGFFWISIGVYGKSSSHPLIHHPKRSKIKSLRSFIDEEEFSKIRLFLSLHIVHRMMKKIASHTFLKKEFLDVHCHWLKASIKEYGKAHLIFHNSSHQFHNWWESEQWRSRCSQVSGSDEQRGQMSLSILMIPREANLLRVLILPISAIHTKTSILWGTSPFHMPLMASWWPGGRSFSSSWERDFVENSPDMLWAQMNLSWASKLGQTCCNILSRLAFSQMSCGLRARRHSKHQTQLKPSQKPWAAMVAFFFGS